MDLAATIISTLVLLICLAYIIKETRRRKKKSEAVETNYNINVSLIFYLITSPLIIGLHTVYYLNAYPTAKSFAIFFTSLDFLILPLISYGLARKKFIATRYTLEIYKFFYRKTIAIQDLTKIKNYTLSSKIYSKDKLLVSMDRR